MGNRFSSKGKYVVWVEDNENGTSTVYSTDSIFWYKFYRGGSE